MTTVSVGPYSPSMPTSPYTCFFANVTKILPGPQMMSTRGTVSVPNAMAAMAWAPPMRNMRSTPAMSAATSTAGAGIWSPLVGVQTMTSSTPATLAGMAVISTVDG